MLVVFLLVVFAAAPSLSCNGCSIKNFKLETCLKGTEKYADLQCEDPIITTDCQLLVNCTRNIHKRITSLTAKVTVTFHGIPIVLKFQDGCEELRNLDSDSAYVKIIKSYPPPPQFPFECPEEPVHDGFVPIKMNIIEEHRKMLPGFAGRGTAKFEVSNINGIPGPNVCYKVSGNLDCGGLFRG